MIAALSTVMLANGLTLSYVDQGDPMAPTAVLVPGATDSLWSYQPVLSRLPRSIRAIAVSLRGHGDSDKPASGYGVEDFAADVVLLLDALEIDRAVLVGHSSSCLVVRRVAVQAPDRVAGLVLEASPTTLRNHDALEHLVESFDTGLSDPVDPAFARALVTNTSSAQLGAQLIDVLVHEVMKVPARVWRETFGALRQYDDAADLPRITAPALLIWGTADGLVLRSMQDELLRLLPAGRLLEYHGIGHTPRWEDPARFASDLACFDPLRGATD